MTQEGDEMYTATHKPTQKVEAGISARNWGI